MVLDIQLLSVHKNKILSKKMQSKLFWYYCFTENDISTPKVYYFTPFLIENAHIIIILYIYLPPQLVLKFSRGLS